jgi:hypothetical protein
MLSVRDYSQPRIRPVAAVPRGMLSASLPGHPSICWTPDSWNGTCQIARIRDVNSTPSEHRFGPRAAEATMLASRSTRRTQRRKRSAAPQWRLPVCVPRVLALSECPIREKPAHSTAVGTWPQPVLPPQAASQLHHGRKHHRLQHAGDQEEHDSKVAHRKRRPNYSRRFIPGCAYEDHGDSRQKHREVCQSDEGILSPPVSPITKLNTRDNP